MFFHEIQRRRVRAALAAATLFVAWFAIPASAQEPAQTSAVSIPVKLVQRLSSHDAKAGDQFTFATTQSVRVGDVSIPPGTNGHGVVASARAARGDRGGDLALQVQSLDLPGGGTLPVTAAPKGGPKSEKQSTVKEAAQAAASEAKSTATVPPVLVPLEAPIHGIVLLGSALHMLKGHDVVFDAGTPFTVVATAPAAAAPEASAAPSVAPRSRGGRRASAPASTAKALGLRRRGRRSEDSVATKTTIDLTRILGGIGERLRLRERVGALPNVESERTRQLRGRVRGG
jgi:hypothetical protein